LSEVESAAAYIAAGNPEVFQPVRVLQPGLDHPVALVGELCVWKFRPCRRLVPDFQYFRHLALAGVCRRRTRGFCFYMGCGCGCGCGCECGCGCGCGCGSSVTLRHCNVTVRHRSVTFVLAA